jgi:secernin
MCDVLVALGEATASGRTLFAKNSDRPPAERQVVEWSAPRLDRSHTVVTHIDVPAHPAATLACVLSRPEWGWGAEHGVNEAGVAVGNTTVYTTLDPRNAPLGLTGMDIVRLALERASSAAEAVEVVTSMIERWGQGGSGHDPRLEPRGRPYWNAFLVADPDAAFAIDTSGVEWAVEQVGSTRAISNRTSVPGFDESHRHPRQPVERLVDPRWRASQAVLATKPLTVEALQRHLRSHDSCGDEGWSVCMHAADVQVTTASMVAELTAHGGSVLWVLTGSPCERGYTRVAFAEAATFDLASA